ncbi:MAG TPA: hypothetical protein VFE32_06780 [Puia sp.]|nr:hypothetical protein [Puia sp.]
MKDLIRGGLTVPAHNMHIALRVASALCFIGHGAFGIITKPIWCNYFAVFGIGHDLAYKLMPVAGTVDILMGLSLLIYPITAIVGWLVIWGAVTALLRPLSGESTGEFVERAGNFGAPLAWLLLSGWHGLWSRPDAYPQPDKRRFNRVVTGLRVVVFLLLLGHGWLNWTEKKSLLAQYSALGFSNPIHIAHAAGIFEMIAAVALLIKPLRPLLLILFVWKMSTELLYPHWGMFEWIERAGSYGSLLALWLALGKSEPSTITSNNQILSAS